MRPHPLRRLLVFMLFVFALAAAAGPGSRVVSRLMAAESADPNAYLPAIFNRAEGQQPNPTPDGTQTRPPKATETVAPTSEGTPGSTSTKTPTPVATNTPGTLPTTTPGLTPLTPTATPSPTAQSSQAIVLPNHSAYVDRAHDLHVVGEVLNTGATTIQFVNLKAAFYSGGGVELDDSLVYAALTILPPGEKTCFEFVLPEPQGFAYYEFADVQHLPVTYPLPTLVVSNLLAEYDPAYGFYNLAGKVTNNGAEPMLDVYAIATIYDADGVVRGCAKEPVGLDDEHHDLLPGDFEPFEIVFTGRDNADVSSYRVQADGTYPDEE